MPEEDSLPIRHGRRAFRNHEHEGDVLAGATNSMIVSVESRKGGVGKTTAALNLGSLLLEPGKTAVLLIDADITGTSAADGLDSLYWRQTTHRVDTADRSGLMRANLLELFDRDYMTGAGVPTFTPLKPLGREKSLSFDPDKLNVLGSQLYVQSVEAHKKGVSYICEPGVLFDDLHAYWFVEFLQRVCESFRDAVINHRSGMDVAIVIDNSPGFIGIAPSIQEWLTDLGPNRGKFLFVTSLDPQDLRSCTFAVEALHEKLISKVRASTALNQLTSPGPSEPAELTSSSETFLEQLAESMWSRSPDSSLQRPGLAVFSPDMRFYTEEPADIRNYFVARPDAYMAMVVNRVPARIGRRQLRNNLELRLSEIRRETHGLDRLVIDELLRSRGGGRFKTLVYYDDAIEYQFLDQGNQRPGDRSYRRRHGLVAAIEKRMNRIEAELSDDPTSNLLHPAEASTPSMDMISTYVTRAQAVVTELLGLLETYGAGYLTRLVRDEWQPVPSFRRLRDVISDVLDDADVGMEYVRDEELEMRRGRNEHNEMFQRLEQELVRSAGASAGSTSGRITMFIPCMAAAILTALRGSPTARVMGAVELISRRLAELAVQQAKSWASLSDSTGTTAIGPAFFANYGRSIGADWQTSRAEYDELAIRLAQEVSYAQARLLDMRNDVMFLLRLVRDASQAGDRPGAPAVPNLRDVADQVILDKTLPHAVAEDAMREALRSEQHMRQFSEVLKLTLAGWGRPR
jgi:hypothetical protein